MKNDALPPNALILFGLVGTLTDAGPRYAEAFRAALAARGGAAPSQEEILKLLGDKNLGEITDRFAKIDAPKAKADFMKACNDNCDALLARPGWKEDLYPGIKTALAALTEAGGALGVFTGSRDEALQQQLTHHGLDGFFPPSRRAGKEAQHAAALAIPQLKTQLIVDLAARHRQAFPGAPVVVVGDSCADAEAAHSLGFYFIGYAPERAKAKKLRQTSLGPVISNYKFLPKTIAAVLSRQEIATKRNQKRSKTI